MSFLVFREFETKISPVLISPTTTNQDQASNEVLRHAKNHQIYQLLQRNFSPAGFPVPFSLLPPSLPWERALESFSVVQQTPFIYPIPLVSPRCCCASAEQGTAPVLSKPQGSRGISLDPLAYWECFRIPSCVPQHFKPHPLCFSPQYCQF